MRWLLWLIPREWRDTVVADLEDDQRQLRRSAWWAAQQAARVGVRLRVVVTGGAMVTDLKYVVRSLWRSRWFAVAASLMLAVGIGVNLAVFNIVDRALFRSLPFHDEGRLIFVSPYQPSTGQRGVAFDRRLFAAAREAVPAIEDMAYISSFPQSTYAVPGDSGPSLALSDASYNVLDVLGVTMARGRGFTRDDARRKDRLAVITYETWQRRFRGSETVIGTRAGSGADAITIVGVLPEGFIRPVLNHWTRNDGLTLDDELFEGPAPGNLSPGVARLAPGATADQAFAQLTALGERMDPQLRGTRPYGPRVDVDSLRGGMFTFAYRYLWLVALAASLVACLTAANLSGLLLARGRDRMRDVALRASLGAGRGRLLTTELGQSLAICGAACVAALVVLALVDHRLVELVPPYLRAFVLTSIDTRVVSAALLVTTACAAIAAGAPTWAASRVDLLTVLKAAGGASTHARTSMLGRWVVGVEVTIAVVLVAGAAMVLRSYVGLATADMGFVVAGLQEVSIAPRGDRAGGDDVAERARYLRFLDQLRRHPDVVHAAASDSVPGGGSAPMMGMRFEGGVSAGLLQVTDGWIEAMGLRLVAGESVQRQDVDQERPVALVTENLARRLWPDVSHAQDALGRVLRTQGQPERRVIGVLADIRTSPSRAADPRVVIPVSHEQFWFLEYVVRTRSGAPVDTEGLMRDSGAALGITSVVARPAGTSIASELLQPKLQTLIFGSFAIVGLVVAAIGLFAVLSFELGWRRYEFGIRASLGASRRDLMRVIFTLALRPVLIGTAVGVSIAWWVSGVVRTLVVGIDVRDPWTLLIVSATLVGVAALAAWLPARRASRVDPVIVLRQS